jgi:hypothetical protein
MPRVFKRSSSALQEGSKLLPSPLQIEGPRREGQEQGGGKWQSP